MALLSPLQNKIRFRLGGIDLVSNGAKWIWELVN
jgi:hypothetical protein